MTLLLDRRGDQVTITEEVVIATAGNCTNIYIIIMFILRLAPGPFGPSMCFLSIHAASHKFHTAQATNF
jgi:hypothetical protein